MRPGAARRNGPGTDGTRLGHRFGSFDGGACFIGLAAQESSPAHSTAIFSTGGRRKSTIIPGRAVWPGSRARTEKNRTGAVQGVFLPAQAGLLSWGVIVMKTTPPCSSLLFSGARSASFQASRILPCPRAPGVYTHTPGGHAGQGHDRALGTEGHGGARGHGHTILDWVATQTLARRGPASVATIW